MTNKNERPVHFSQFFKIKKKESDLDFFDTNVYRDSALFIDPFLIKSSSRDEHKDLYSRFDKYFTFALEKSIRTTMDPKEIQSTLRFLEVKEPKETCLGFTEKSHDGSGPGKTLANTLLRYFVTNTAKRLINQKNLYSDNKIDPEFITIFADGIAEDGISDLSTNLIMDYLVKYTQKQCEELGVPLTPDLPVSQTFDFEEMEWTGGRYYSLPENPVKKGSPIILVPKIFLRCEDVDLDRSFKTKVVGILKADPVTRTRFANVIFRPLKDIKDDELKEIILSDDNLLKRYIDLIEKRYPKHYDFDIDPLLFLANKKYQNYFDNQSLLPEPKNSEKLLEVTLKLINTFKENFELKDYWRDCWQNGHPIKEVVWGRAFRALGENYFSFYPSVTFDSEVESDRGPIDFRVVYKDSRIGIELKKLCNSSPKGKDNIPSYLHGIKIQLPIYSVNIKATYSIYLTGQHFKRNRFSRKDDSNRVKEIESFIPSIKNEIVSRLSTFKDLLYINIDLSEKPSASNT